MAPDDCGWIVERCEAVLRDSSHHSLRRLKCDFAEGVLSLHGVVPTYYLRQLAQALLANLENVKEINNKVVVQRRNARFEHW